MKVSVVGSINMDMTVTTGRIPMKGETVKGNTLDYIPGGKGANQAIAMAKLGAKVQMFGCVGNDGAGEISLGNLKQYGVNTDYVRVLDGVLTGIALITVAENDNVIVVVAGANGCVDCAYIDSVKDALLQSDIVVLQHEIPLETVEYVINLCYEKGVKTILNPAPAAKVSPEIVDKVSFLTPNEHEAKIIFGEIPVEQLLRRYPEKLIITQGSRGVSTCLEEGTILNIPAQKVSVVDTTGAGDTLNGAFTVQIANGEPIEKALYFANIAAGLSVGKFGAQGGMPSYEEVENAMTRGHCITGEAVNVDK